MSVAMGGLLTSCILDRDGAFEPPSGTSNGGQGGVVIECTVPEDCGEETPCRLNTCTDGQCGQRSVDFNTSCGPNGEVCNGSGGCVLADGTACTSGTQCASLNCIDAVCCDQRCDGDCVSCGISGSVGTCTAHSSGTDPTSDCGMGTCDGAGNCANGGTLDSVRFGGTDNDGGAAIVADDSDGMFLGASFSAAITLGGTFTASFRDGIVAKLDSALNPQWGRQLGGFGDELVVEVGVDGLGNVYVAGIFDFDFEAGPGPTIHPSLGSTDIFLAKFDADGNYFWSRAYGGSGADVVRDMHVADDGTVTLIGYTEQSISFDGGATTLTTAGSRDVVVGVIDSSGNHVRSRRWGSTGVEEGLGVTVDAAGSVWIVGSFTSTFDLGGAPLGITTFTDAFVAKLAVDLSHQWSFAIPSTGAAFAWHVSIGGDGNGVVAGEFDGQATLGGMSVVAFDAARDVFVLQLDSANGSTSWSSSFGAQGEQQIHELALDDWGNLLLIGSNAGTIDFGGGNLTTSGSHDMFVAKLAADGNHLFSRGFGDINEQHGFGISFSSDERVLTTGYFVGTIDFGDGTVHATPGLSDSDIFVAAFEP